MVRIAVGGLMHESNTFAASLTEVSDFESGGLETGPGIFDRWGAAHHEVGGFFEGSQRFGFEAVPTLMGWATPSGPLSAAAYAELTDRLLGAIRTAGPVDAVLLALHGAMAVEGLDDADGSTLVRVRDLIGPDRPLIVSLDFHGNISPLVGQMSNALVAYRTYPHVDQRARGFKAAEIAYWTATGKVRPTQALRKPPMLVPILAQETDREPFKGMMDSLADLDHTRGILDASVMGGFAYADVAAIGPTCIVVTDNDPALAAETADHLADRLWSLRRELTTMPPSPAEAVKQVLAGKKTPVILVDIGDNVGGGSAADSTVLIQEWVRQKGTGAIVALYDPSAVQECTRAGVGGNVSLKVGGKVDHNAAPLPIQGKLQTLHDGRYVEPMPRHGGIRQNDQGPTAVVETTEGNTIVLNSLRHPPFSLGQLTSLGLRPETARAIIVKSAVAYKAAYEPIAGSIIEVDTPGLTAVNPTHFNYRHIRRPILPLDPESKIVFPPPPE
jgi:microcystin degradation protein MlrC